MKPSDLWFRFTNGTDSIYGRKEFKDLVFTIKTRGILLDIKVDRQSAEKMKEWLNRAFPSQRSADVRQLSPALPLPDNTGNSEPHGSQSDD